MLTRCTTLFGLLALLRIVISSRQNTPLKTEPLPGPGLQGWNELIGGADIFNVGANVVDAMSRDANIILQELTQLLSQDDVVQDAYDNYRKQYKGTYDMERGNIQDFKRKVLEIATQNLKVISGSGEDGWWMGVNQFSDLSPEELDEAIPEPTHNVENMTSASPYVSAIGATPPTSLSYVEQKKVSPAKNQNGGASGAIFAVASVAETAQGIKSNWNSPFSASEQQLVDCVGEFCKKYSSTCVGTEIDKLFIYTRYEGLNAYNDYPYTNPPAVGPCRKNSKILIGLDAHTVTPTNTDASLKQLLTDRGTAVVNMYMSPSLMTSYGGGVYPGSECGTNAGNQAMALVGYGSAGGRDYWLLKNSLGQKWGEQGYLRLARNGKNVCGVLGPAFTVLAR